VSSRRSVSERHVAIRVGGGVDRYHGPVFSEVAKILTVTERGGVITVTSVDDAPPLGGA